MKSDSEIHRTNHPLTPWVWALTYSGIVIIVKKKPNAPFHAEQYFGRDLLEA